MNVWEALYIFCSRLTCDICFCETYSSSIASYWTGGKDVWNLKMKEVIIPQRNMSTSENVQGFSESSVFLCALLV